MENPKDIEQKHTDQKHDQKYPENKPNTDNQKKPVGGLEDVKQTPRPVVVPHTDEHKEPEKKRA
jgi:hypothetical protein